MQTEVREEEQQFGPGPVRPEGLRRPRVKLAFVFKEGTLGGDLDWGAPRLLGGI